MLKVILERMRAKVEFEISEDQAGFRPGRGTHNHLCSLRLITEPARARRLPVYMCFIDTVHHVHHVSNEEVLGRMSTERLLVGRIKHRKLAYFGHVVRHASLKKDIMIGPMPGLRSQGGQRRQWLDDLAQWTRLTLPELARLPVEDLAVWRRFVHEVAYAPS